jgi:uncharacterized protein YbbK (DUF523 family)
MANDPNIRIAVSACLLGERVRYDGETKPHAWVRDELSRLAELVPVCPEGELGMDVPREPVDLIGDPTAPRMVGVTSSEDWTERMNAWCGGRIAELVAEGLDGVVLKSRSPSCGIGSTPVYPEPGAEPRLGDGLFALALRMTCPDLAITEDEDLDDPDKRAAFLECVKNAANRRRG